MHLKCITSVTWSLQEAPKTLPGRPKTDFAALLGRQLGAKLGPCWPLFPAKTLPWRIQDDPRCFPESFASPETAQEASRPPPEPSRSHFWTIFDWFLLHFWTIFGWIFGSFFDWFFPSFFAEFLFHLRSYTSLSQRYITRNIKRWVRRVIMKKIPSSIVLIDFLLHFLLNFCSIWGLIHH